MVISLLNLNLQRTIAVDVRYILFIIDKYAGAQNIIDELNLVRTAKEQTGAAMPSTFYSAS